MKPDIRPDTGYKKAGYPVQPYYQLTHSVLQEQDIQIHNMQASLASLQSKVSAGEDNIRSRNHNHTSVVVVVYHVTIVAIGHGLLKKFGLWY